MSNQDINNLILDFAAQRGIRASKLRGERGTREVSDMRLELYARLRAKGVSYPRIGAHLGGRDHATVIKGERAYYQRLAVEAWLTPAYTRVNMAAEGAGL